MVGEFDLLTAVAQVGFPIAVAVFLLWKGYTQDREYLICLKELQAEIKALREKIDRT